MSFSKLIDWSLSQHSNLPWRQKRTLYRTFVSEIMLQQTTVGTVLNHFEKFLLRFPNIKSLALATEDELLREWKGLGYYRRARNLKKAAEYIYSHFNGKFPRVYKQLLDVPGVGPYTAGAIQAMGRDIHELPLDANLERVLARYYGIKVEKGPKLHKEIYRLYEEGKILKKRTNFSARELYESIMDLGRVYCQSRKASCFHCPLSANCQARKSGEPEALPVMKEIKKESFELELLRVIVRSKDQILCYQKNEKEWLSGQDEIPTFILNSQDTKLKQYPKTKFKIKKSKTYKTGITKYKITNHIVEMQEKDFKKNFSVDRYEFKEVSRANLSTASTKALKKLEVSP